jgi:hypothetical protein
MRPKSNHNSLTVALNCSFFQSLKNFLMTDMYTIKGAVGYNCVGQFAKIFEAVVNLHI